MEFLPPNYMETEYIRGKQEERNGALSARPPARFTPRGNDVWAHRSGRVYQAPVEGGAVDFSSPVTGNGEHGMGKLSNLVGSARRKHRSRSSSCEGGAEVARNKQYDDGDMDAPRGQPASSGMKYPSGQRVLPEGSFAKGGAEHMMSPMDAKRLTMMDYRGGRHPYLTRGGAVRKHLKGTGIWDSIKSLAKKTANEFTNPDSLLRGTYAKTAADLAELIPDERAQAFAKAARNLQKGEYADLAKTAGEAYLRGQKASDRSKTGKTLGEIARGLKGQPKPKFMSDMPSMMELEDKPRTYNFTNDFRGRKPILPGRTRNMPLMLEDMPRPSRSRNMPLMLEDATDADLRDMKFQRSANKLSKTLGREVKYADKRYEVGDGRPVGGARSKRGAMVAKIMRERGVSLPEASRIVKAEGLA